MHCATVRFTSELSYRIKWWKALFKYACDVEIDRWEVKLLTTYLPFNYSWQNVKIHRCPYLPALGFDSVCEHCPSRLGLEHQLRTELWMKRFWDLNWRSWSHNSLLYALQYSTFMRLWFMSWQPHRSLLFLQEHLRSVAFSQCESRGLTGSKTPDYSLYHFGPTFIGIHPEMNYHVPNPYDFLSSVRNTTGEFLRNILTTLVQSLFTENVVINNIFVLSSTDVVMPTFLTDSFFLAGPLND